MKATTLHTNAFGTVVNQSSANGFRLEDDHGAYIEAHVVDGYLRIESKLWDQKIDQQLRVICRNCGKPA